MRIEIIDDGIKIFIQNGFIKNIDWDDKEQVVESIKNLFNKIRKKYHLYIKGLYKVKVYPNKIGTYIEAIQLEEESYTNADLDLRIILVLQKELYLKIDDSSFAINTDLPYFYKNNSYYIDVDNIDDITPYIEFGTIVSEEI